MNDLVCVQEQFQKFLLSGYAGIEKCIVPTESLSVETRLAIYRDAYKLRLIESLTINFPGLLAWLGTAEFEKLCTAYIDAHPSSYRSIRWYGNTLADFLKSYYKKENPYLSELAEFEWNMTLAFDAADVEVVQVEDMASVPAESWAGIQFGFHPSVQRMNYFWNVIPVWQALINEKEVPLLDNNTKAVPWLLWRSPDYVIQFYSLSAEEAWAIDAITQGLSFADLCEGLCQWVAVHEVGMRAASYLKAWIQNGMVSRLLFSA